MIIIPTKIVTWFSASAITAFPFVFVDPEVQANPPQYETLKKHEYVHYDQQKRWCLYGLGIGLIIWHLLYLLFLPVGWNPLRQKAETEAFLAQGYDIKTINRILKEAPYYLWW